jgi:hypothetical protein
MAIGHVGLLLERAGHGTCRTPDDGANRADDGGPFGGCVPDGPVPLQSLAL